MYTTLDSLSVELLIKIFEYCDIVELCRLQATCRKFYHVVNEATSLGNVLPPPVCNQLTQEIRNRSNKLLTFKEKHRILDNWENGIYNEKFLLKVRKFCMPWLVLTKDHLWLSRGHEICCYDRKKIGNLRLAEINTAADVCKFVYKQNYIVSGQVNGSLNIWKIEGSIDIKNCHESDINAVDVVNDIVATGSKDHKVNIWLLCTHTLQQHPHYSFDMNDRVLSTAFCYGGQSLAVGTGGCSSVPPLQIIDLNSCKVVQPFQDNFRNGAGSLQVKWEDRNTLLSCGYDTRVRKWDTRTGRCEQVWEDPFDATVYCFETDNYCTVVTGTSYYGRMVLWDMRMTNYIQMYYVHTCGKSRSSPVYSLSFDSNQLFAATDRYLNILDFSIYHGISKDFKYALMSY